MRTVREAIMWFIGVATIVLAVRFFSEKELAAVAVVFLAGIFWRLSDLKETVHSIAAKLGHGRTRSRRIEVLMKRLLRDKLTEPENNELTELTLADQNEGPATWGQLVRVIESLYKVNKQLAADKWRKKIMRDEHGNPRLVYEHEVQTALQKGWMLPEFSVVLTQVGPNSINVIMAVRKVTGLNLEEAKDLVDSAPNRIAQVFTREEATSISKNFVDLGAKVEIE